ncbi:LysR family transcriptional regulator [Leucobacter musarum]|uniref:LysR family transcriptional regulator n=1 Tax=Leucobacter musarum TaxID=1930747 RepID=UPI0006A77CCD|nr:LysR family transcriptional regulator [Leucobacter musarum]
MQRFPITLTQLVYFAECAKTLNMTVASGNLHVAQSAVSTAITQLERSLGASLFIRQHAKGLILTEAGQRLLFDSHHLFGSLQETIDSIRETQYRVSGPVTVACFNTLAPFLLPRLLSALRAEHPELEVSVIEGDHSECLAALRDGRAEIALTYDLPFGDGIDSTVVAEFRPHVILPTSHPLAGNPATRLSDLEDEPFVLLDLPSSSDYFIRILTDAGITPNLRYRSSSYETVRSMVAMGLGFSILNQRPRTAETYAGECTAIVEIADPVASLTLEVSSLQQVRRSRRAQAVQEAVARAFEGAPSAT